MTWAENLKLLEKYSARSAKIFRLALIRHFNKMLEAAQDNGFQGLEMILPRVDDTDIRKAFLKTYQGAGVDMAFNTYDELTSGKKARSFIGEGAARKKVRDEWLKQLEHIVLDETIPAQGAVLTTSKDLFIDYVDNAISEGMTLSETATGLRRRFRELAPWRSFNIARTETLSAMNFGAEIGAQETGYQFKRTWLASLDGRERKSHAAVSGTSDMNGVWLVEQPTGGSPDLMRFPGDPRASAANRVNCYLPGNFIESNIIEGQKSFYSGKAIEIITRRGERISVTPNHGILTDKGLVAAKDIEIGTNLVCNRVHNNRIVRLINNYVKQKVFMVENIFSSLQILWRFKNRVVAGLDFDGDGESMYGNICIVYPYSKLRNGIKSKFINCINKLSFKDTGFVSTQISSFSPFKFFAGTNKSAYASLMSFLYLSFPLCFRHFLPLKKFSLGLASKMDTKGLKIPDNAISADGKFFRKLIDTNSRFISFDDVVYVGEINFSGHVYDFSSYNGVNIVNNIYTSNCRCTVVRELI